MSVRSMVAEDLADDGRAMDEPTIDCRICGGPATTEIRDEYLNDSAEWYSAYRYVVCDEHLASVKLVLARLEPHERVVLQRCC